MALSSSAFATEYDLPMQFGGQLCRSRLALLKMNQTAVPYAGNIKTTAFAALPVLVYGHGLGQGRISSG